MKQSFLFSKTLRQDPKDEESVNARLLIRGGFIHKEMAGVYAFLPLGLRVLNNIIEIIREEMNKIGGQEVLLTGLQDPEVWKKSGRWDDNVVDVWFKTKLSHGGELGLSNTHEEPLTRLLKGHINSYKDLPKYVYQFQTKYRNEPRAKSGLQRTREFIMKDLYSFCEDETHHQEFYAKAANAYKNIFERLGIGDRTFYTYASGGSFSKYSHEFQAISDSGEDTIFLDRKRGVAVNLFDLLPEFSATKEGKEVLKESKAKAILDEFGFIAEDLEMVKACEVGNIFPLGTKYSKALELTFTDRNGKVQNPYMGSYGIGPGRSMGTIVELLHDDKGIIWPESIAPFKVHILCDNNSKEAVKQSEELYAKLSNNNVQVLLDDREESLPVKLKDSDLIGCPYRVLVSEKSLTSGGFEFKKRNSDTVNIVNEVDLMKIVS